MWEGKPITGVWGGVPSRVQGKAPGAGSLKLKAFFKTVSKSVLKFFNAKQLVTRRHIQGGTDGKACIMLSENIDNINKLLQRLLYHHHRHKL